MVVCQKAHVANIADWPDNFVAKNKSASVSHLPQLLSSDPLQKLCPKKGWEMRGGKYFSFFVDIEYWPRLKILANLLWGITITLQCEKRLEKCVAHMLTINLGQTPFKLNQNILPALNSFIPSLKLFWNFQWHLKPSETHLLKAVEALERWMVSRWEEGWDGYWPAGKKTRQIEAFSRTTTLD